MQNTTAERLRAEYERRAMRRSQVIPGGLLPKLQNLMSINLSYNSLSTLPDDIGALK